MNNNHEPLYLWRSFRAGEAWSEVYGEAQNVPLAAARIASGLMGKKKKESINSLSNKFLWKNIMKKKSLWCIYFEAGFTTNETAPLPLQLVTLQVWQKLKNKTQHNPLPPPPKGLNCSFYNQCGLCPYYVTILLWSLSILCLFDLIK